ncbi:MAG: phosphotransferase family protein [Candidatus Eremiobacteraeota bacterium]|nr:phosphotransferase family protein [Candidatus Eremiobacteraeota bacterium]
MNDTIDVRPGETLEVALLEPYLRERLPGAEGPFGLRQFGGGHANLTYLVAFGEREYVLRRPPHGPLPKGGHDMRREYRVLSLLWEAFPLAPRAFVLCTDHSIIGADFVVMERRKGIVIRRTLPPALQDDAAAQRRLGENFIDTLAALHMVDYETAGLAGLGKPGGYLERQLSGWVDRWQAARTPLQADATRLIERLVERRPESGPPGLVHNDFKFDNAIVDAADPARFVAILDWDMCTVGDPLADLGNVLSLWREPSDRKIETTSTSIMPTDTGNFPTRAEMIERYARTTGRDCSRALWYQAFNVFRYAAIAQQIYARYVRGQTADPRFAGMNVWVASLIEKGLELADKGI